LADIEGVKGIDEKKCGKMNHSDCETIAVVSILGEPRNPKTWTRSSSIMEAIEKLGYPVVGFDSGIRNRYLQIGLAKLNQLAAHAS